MPISINQISSGTALLVNGQVFVVIEARHVKPGKGGAFVRAKLKNIKTQQVLDKTIKPADKFEDVRLDERKLQNLYASGDTIHFMDTTSFEETLIPKDVIGDGIRFLQDNLEVTGVFYNDEILQVILPTFINAEVTQTEPGFKGDTTKAGTKPATIETGALVQVPLFVNIGDKIKIDTRTGSYVERVK